jgi:beta-phosphoglucomutase-like phosphatase (HAD superfamily)
MTSTLQDMHPFSAIIFDCDGTLVDSVPAHLAALQQVLSMRGLTMQEEWYHRHHSLTADDLLLTFERDGLGALRDKHALLADHQRLFLEHLHLLDEVAVVTNLARQWHGRVPLGVASNGHRLNVEATLKATGIASLFTTVICREDVVHGKPAPDIYLKAARRLGADADRCVVLEDADTGIQAALAAGARVLDNRLWHTLLRHVGPRNA